MDVNRFLKAQVAHWLNNPKTSVVGATGLLSMLGVCLTAQFDADPNTIPDWIALVMSALGCWFLMGATDTVKGVNDPNTSLTRAELGVPSTCPHRVIPMADDSAQPGMVYFSIDAGAPAFKDSDGHIHRVISFSGDPQP